MTDEAHDHNGTLVASDQAALIVGPDGSCRLLLPCVPEDSDASLGHALITAIALKIGDSAWVREMLLALENARKNLS